MLLAKRVYLTTWCKGIIEHCHDRFRVIVSGNAVDGEGLAFEAFMDQHQLAARLGPVLVPARLHRQADGLHRCLASRQAIAGGEQVQVAGPQAVGTVIPVIHPGEQMGAGDQGMAVVAAKVTKGGETGSHSSSRRRR